MSGINLHRRYGQVLLNNRGIAIREADTLGLGAGSHVLEIGPGTGILTQVLLERGLKVTAVEADHNMYDEIRWKFQKFVESGQLVPVKQDFLEFQAGEYDGIIGNIPYHITSQIVFRLPEFRFRRAVIMVQREFAERMVAAPGSRDYSRLSVSVALRFNARIEKIVARKYFRPVPKVDSAIVSLQPRETPVDMAAVEKVIQRAFSMRRKKLGNIFEGCPQEYAELRPDQISPEAFLDLASRLTGLSPRGHP